MTLHILFEYYMLINCIAKDS